MDSLSAAELARTLAQDTHEESCSIDCFPAEFNTKMLICVASLVVPLLPGLPVADARLQLPFQ